MSQCLILTILIRVLDKNAELLNAQLNGGAVIGHPTADADEDRDHCVDALVQETHGRGAVWIEVVGYGFYEGLGR